MAHMIRTGSQIDFHIKSEPPILVKKKTKLQNLKTKTGIGKKDKITLLSRSKFSQDLNSTAARYNQKNQVKTSIAHKKATIMHNHSSSHKLMQKTFSQNNIQKQIKNEFGSDRNLKVNKLEATINKLDKPDDQSLISKKNQSDILAKLMKSIS